MTGRSFSGKGVLVSAGARAADTGPTNLIVLLKKEDIKFERGSLMGRGVPAPTPGPDSMDYQSKLISRTRMQSIEIINV